MKNLNGKRALLTGASRGIGPFIAEQLSAAGCNLILTARDKEALESVAERYSNKDIQITVITSDMADKNSLKQMVTEATKSSQPIDILINNAGVYECGNFESLEFESIERMLQINLTGLLFLTHLILPGMKERDFGHIVNISSLAGLSGSAFSETYCATKHGVVGFTRALRATLKQTKSKVSASAICPGMISDAGIFHRLNTEDNVKPPAIMGCSSPETVARAVVEAILKDAPEVIINPSPMRPGLAIAALFPRAAEWVALRLGLHAFLPPGQSE